MNESQLYRIAQLEQKKAEYLASHPHMKYIQDKIDATLEEVGSDPVERCRALNLIMLQSMQELSNSMADLENYVRDSKLSEQLEGLASTLKEFYSESGSQETKNP